MTTESRLTILAAAAMLSSLLPTMSAEHTFVGITYDDDEAATPDALLGNSAVLGPVTLSAGLPSGATGTINMPSTSPFF